MRRAPAAWPRTPDTGCRGARHRRSPPRRSRTAAAPAGACRRSGSSPSAARSRAAARARSRAPTPWSWRCPTASPSSPACRSVPPWSCSYRLPFRGARLVGAAGFEPATFWSQTRRATRLRYAPGAARALDTRFGFGAASAQAGDLPPARAGSMRRLGCRASGLQPEDGLVRGRADRHAFRPDLGRHQALGPGPKRTRTNWPGRSSVMP